MPVIADLQALAEESHANDRRVAVMRAGQVWQRCRALNRTARMQVVEEGGRSTQALVELEVAGIAQECSRCRMAV